MDGSQLHLVPGGLTWENKGTVVSGTQRCPGFSGLACIPGRTAASIHRTAAACRLCCAQQASGEVSANPEPGVGGLSRPDMVSVPLLLLSLARVCMWAGLAGLATACPVSAWRHAEP